MLFERIKKLISPAPAIIFFPVVHIMMKTLKMNVEPAQNWLIGWNNIYVTELIRRKKIDIKKILLILPHCLQNSSCEYNVSWDKLSNCRLCGKCVIKEFKTLTRNNVEPIVVTGGRAAREAVKRAGPDLIIATACEEDLFAGIRDVKGIPVLGITNRRPNGPCKDTVIDFNEVKDYLDFILD